MKQSLMLNKMGLTQLPENEMQEIDGGIIPFLVLGAALLLSGCIQQNQQNGHHNNQNNSQTNGQNVGDSINNKNNGKVTIIP